MVALGLRRKRKLERKDIKWSFGLTQFEMLWRASGLEIRASGKMEVNIWKSLALQCSLKKGDSFYAYT